MKVVKATFMKILTLRSSYMTPEGVERQVMHFHCFPTALCGCSTTPVLDIYTHLAYSYRLPGDLYESDNLGRHG